VHCFENHTNPKYTGEMSRICQITGKKLMVGNNVSHSNKKTKRRFYPNIMNKRFFLEEENRWVTLRVSAAGIRNINKKGLKSALKEAQQKGLINIY